MFYGLKHNPEALKAAVSLVGERLVAKIPLRMYIPKRYLERGLAKIGTEIYTLGFFALATDKEYTVSLTCAMVPTEPTHVKTVKIDDESYLEFSYDPGAAIMKTINLVMIDTLAYKVYNEFIASARIPSFISYEHAGMMFRTAYKHTGAKGGGIKIGEQEDVTRLLVSIIARSTTNRQIFIRSTVTKPEDLYTAKVNYIALSSIAAANDTVSRTSGAHFGDGVIGAIVNPSDTVEDFENILRQ